MTPELAIAAYAADAAWAAVIASWVSAGVNLAVVIAAFVVPYLVRRWEREKTYRVSGHALLTGVSALSAIRDAEDWLEGAAKAPSRTVQDRQNTVRRQIAGYRHSIEVALNRGVDDPDVMAYLAEVLMLVKEAEDVLRDLPKLIVADGVGVELLTSRRLKDLGSAARSLSEMSEHRHFASQKGEMLMSEFAAALRR